MIGHLKKKKDFNVMSVDIKNIDWYVNSSLDNVCLRFLQESIDKYLIA